VLFPLGTTGCALNLISTFFLPLFSNVAIRIFSLITRYPNDSEVVPSGNNTPNDSEENERKSIVTPEKQTSRKQRYITITPRKQAKYLSPPKRIVTRKRKANPDKRQKNVRKRLRQAGSEYTDTKGKIVEAREMKDIDCNKCRFECSLNTDEDNRRRIFQEYWGLKSYDRQRDFIFL
jgi:hypothetical protein